MRPSEIVEELAQLNPDALPLTSTTAERIAVLAGEAVDGFPTDGVADELIATVETQNGRIRARCQLFGTARKNDRPARPEASSPRSRSSRRSFRIP